MGPTTNHSRIEDHPKKIAQLAETIRPKQISREFVYFGLASIGSSAVTYLVTLWVAKILGPGDFGKWNVINLCVLYGAFLQFGILNGMGREVPYLIGSQNLSAAAGMINNAWTTVLLSSAAFTLLLFGLGPLVVQEEGDWNSGLFSLTILYFISRNYQDFIRMYLRSTFVMKLFSYQLILATLFILISVPLSQKFHLKGFVMSQAVAFCLSSYMAKRAAKWEFRVAFQPEVLWHLIRAGFPIFLVGIVYGLMTTIDRWVILTYLGIEPLGFYTLSILILGLATLFPGIISNYLYPQMSRVYGGTNNILALRSYVFKEMIFGCAIAIPFCLLSLFILPMFVHALMPQYIPGLSAMKITVFSGLVLPFATSIGDFLNVIGKQWVYLRCLLVALLMNGACTYFFINHLKMGIIGAAWSTLIAFSAYAVLMGIAGWWFISSSQK